jgi:hypothetical protein
MPPERSYTEREVADIIERAVERQEAARERASTEGLTLSDLERLGQEVGIDPAHLLAAAEELDGAGRTLRRQSSTTKTHISVERWIDAPLTPEAWEDAVEEATSRFGADASALMGNSAAGMSRQVGLGYEWTHTSGLGVQTRLVASERGGRTRLRMTQLVGLASPTAEGIGYGALAALLPAFVTAGLVVGGGLEGAAFAAVVALSYLVSLAVCAPIITALDRRWRAKKLALLGDLADDLAPLFSRAAAAVPASPDALPVVTEANRPALDLDALGEADEPLDGALDGARRARTRT